MEIQSFLLAKEIQQAGPGSDYRAETIGLHHFYSADEKYPFEFTVPYYMLIRRESDESDESITLSFNLIDSDGMGLGSPRNQKVEGVFPAKHKFMTIVGTIKFNFPGLGDYRLDITADEGKLPTIFTYNIQIG